MARRTARHPYPAPTMRPTTPAGYAAELRRVYLHVSAVDPERDPFAVVDDEARETLGLTCDEGATASGSAVWVGHTPDGSAVVVEWPTDADGELCDGHTSGDPDERPRRAAAILRADGDAAEAEAERHGTCAETHGDFAEAKARGASMRAHFETLAEAHEAASVWWWANAIACAQAADEADEARTARTSALVAGPAGDHARTVAAHTVAGLRDDARRSDMLADRARERAADHALAGRLADAGPARAKAEAFEAEGKASRAVADAIEAAAAAV